MSGYGRAIPGANRRMTEIGDVNVPVLRHWPQLRFSLSSSAMSHPAPHARFGFDLQISVTIDSQGCWEQAEISTACERLHTRQGACQPVPLILLGFHETAATKPWPVDSANRSCSRPP